MSLVGRALLFVAREAAKPTLEEFGRKVGTAIGRRLGRCIDPEGAKKDDERDDEASCDCDDCIDEDERTP